jgi:hypothetical protein
MLRASQQHYEPSQGLYGKRALTKLFHGGRTNETFVKVFAFMRDA